MYIYTLPDIALMYTLVYVYWYILALSQLHTIDGGQKFTTTDKAQVAHVRSQVHQPNLAPAFHHPLPPNFNVERVCGMLLRTFVTKKPAEHYCRMFILTLKWGGEGGRGGIAHTMRKEAPLKVVAKFRLSSVPQAAFEEKTNTMS